MLQHKETSRIRVLMRRDKTLKICANHYISEGLVLKPNVGSEKSWVYTVDDYSEGVLSLDLLAVRFGNEESKLPRTITITNPITIQCHYQSNYFITSLYRTILIDWQYVHQLTSHFYTILGIPN